MEAGSSGAASLDTIFGSLADATRRDILRRVGSYHLSVGQIAQHYNLTFAAISKHLKVLEKAGLISKRQVGRKHYVQLAPTAFKDASEYLSYYTHFWESNLDSLKNYMEGGRNG